MLLFLSWIKLPLTMAVAEMYVYDLRQDDAEFLYPLGDDIAVD